ncbi:hypothetical protein L1S35_12845 [Flavobacterium sp. AS60]|uniref:hypothetical protein n=1 Tax=Flavobacterium anseongense TaxID=2910677 RepID=UPI001F17F15D|nr:hypothetical protein [Flavobacterium sp. AS60]MCF6130565.1 hypothetical protein [Flavobacterium sp. AS60]
MKKRANASVYSIYSQEINLNFFTASNHFYVIKNDLLALCSPVTFLFQEKLPIIYANIRV